MCKSSENTPDIRSKIFFLSNEILGKFRTEGKRKRILILVEMKRINKIFFFLEKFNTTKKSA